MNKKLLGALALFAAMGLPAAANASLQTLSDLFVFGDSLSDGGNSGIVSRAATGGSITYPPSPYYNGQYSNGPVAVEYLWQSYNPVAPVSPPFRWPAEPTTRSVAQRRGWRASIRSSLAF